ncbi:MAG: transposase, partial [Anaerolineales bacterium]
CREYRLRPPVFSRWREEFLERAPEIFATERSRGDEQERITGLEQMVGRLTMQLEVAKKRLERPDLSLERQREMIDMLAQEYPLTVACEVLGVPRSSYYYQPVKSPDETKLKGAIKKTAAEWPTYGYRRITEQLRRGEWVVNHQRVQRLMGLQAQIKRKQRRTTNSKHGFPRYPNTTTAFYKTVPLTDNGGNTKPLEG